MEVIVMKPESPLLLCKQINNHSKDNCENIVTYIRCLENSDV